jgi:hypothetical protein
MDQKTQKQIEMYLADEEKLLRDWYHSLDNPDYDADITPVGSLPTENIEKIFEEWFEGNKKVVAKICESWLKLKDKKELGAAFLIATLADLLTSLCADFTVPVNASATACILFTKGYIDHYCIEKVK